MDVIKKSQGYLVFMAVLLVLLPIYTHGLIFYLGGLTLESLKYTLIASPFSFIFCYFAYSITNNASNRIVLTEKGIRIDDFEGRTLAWSEINVIQLHEQKVNQMTNYWLILKTKNDLKYVSKKIRNLNKFIGIRGIPVCNLAYYQGTPDNAVEKIKSYHHKYR